jgi:hypothetical protein
VNRDGSSRFQDLLGNVSENAHKINLKFYMILRKLLVSLCNLLDSCAGNNNSNTLLYRILCLLNFSFFKQLLGISLLFAAMLTVPRMNANSHSVNVLNL